MSTSKNTVTPADVAAQAVEEKLVTTSVPTQAENPETVKVVKEEKVELEDGEKVVVKKTLKRRLTEAADKVKENKQFIGGFLLGAGAGALAYARFAAQKAAALTVTLSVVDEDDAETDSSEA
jgi:hypothetical protein